LKAAPVVCAAFLVAIPCALGQEQVHPFQVDRAGEAVAELVMMSPGADWGRAGREAAVADVRVDGGPAFQVMLFAGADRRTYPVFLGRIEPGRHELSIEQNRDHSAPGTSLSVAKVSVRSGLDDPVVAHAPVLYARRNTIGKFSDVPLVVYAEKLVEDGADRIQYTVIFSNEDGGTSTRALMARWGRTTDIEYVYKVDPKTGRAIIQTRDHKDVEFAGKREGKHPLLIPVTDNNMVADEVPSAVRYQIAPFVVDLSQNSREKVMDDDPLLYRAASEELIREGKLRTFGVVEGNKISDPRNYLYLDARIAVKNAGVVTLVRRRDDPQWRSSALGRPDYTVDRSGWIRTTVEMPPGTRPEDIVEIGFTCVVVVDSTTKRYPDTGTCRVENVNKAFFLDSTYRPGASIWSYAEPVVIPAGIIRTFTIR
jgi:hypothetical protein